MEWHRAIESCDCLACEDVKSLAKALFAEQESNRLLRIQVAQQGRTIRVYQEEARSKELGIPPREVS